MASSATPEKVSEPEESKEVPEATAADGLIEPFGVNQHLYEAALDGDWETAKRIFSEDPSKATARLNHQLETPLHVAAGMGRTEFVTNLVKILTDEELEMKTAEDQAALHHAAASGSLSTVMALVDRKSILTQQMDNYKKTPLMFAAYKGVNKEVLWYLTLKSIQEPPHYPFVNTGADAVDNFMVALVETGYYDICLYIVQKYPSLATVRRNGKIGCVSRLARTPSAFLSGSNLSFWEKCIYHYFIGTDMEVEEDSLASYLEGQQLPTSSSPAIPSRFQMFGRIVRAAWEAIEYGMEIKRIKELKYKHKCVHKLLKLIYRELSKWKSEDIRQYFVTDVSLVSAIRKGNVEMLTLLLRHFPFLMRLRHTDGNILEIAIMERQEKVFNLMLEQNNMTRELASHINGTTGDGVLHIAARLAPYPQLSSVSCPALQMQRELQWFKAVEELVAPRYRAWPNKKFILPQQLFTSEHKDLSKEAEQWMKETSNSCMVVATLIATVVFAAAFTVPGGNVDGEGTPLFLKRNAFMVFAVSDAVGMFSSATSILMFLSISTARYAEQDFLYALPMRLILGFASLFMAIASMMVAFGATLYMVLNQRIKWILFPIIGITSIPVGLFIMLQLPLLIFMVRSTYGPSIFRPKKIW